MIPTCEKCSSRGWVPKDPVDGLRLNAYLRNGGVKALQPCWPIEDAGDSSTWVGSLLGTDIEIRICPDDYCQVAGEFVYRVYEAAQLKEKSDANKKDRDPHA
jgi:hypothetical protein